MDFQKGRVELPPRPRALVDPHRGDLVKLASRISKLEKEVADILSRLANSNYLGSHVRNKPMPPKNEESD